MEITILQLLEGAREARGLAVIIDVFRAFSVACYVVANGAKRIIPVADIDRAYELKREHPGYILMGERGGKRPRGFDFGNSPSQIEGVDFSDKTVIHTTSGGTKGLVNARGADEVITGSFVNAGAVAEYTRAKKPQIVSLVCMGAAGERETDEDALCAEYLRDCLEGKAVDFERIVTRLEHCETARSFFDPQKEWIPERDFELCLKLDRFAFVLKAERSQEGFFQLRMHRVGSR
jgi:2-phosphosulfolactate phosphatase